MGQIPWGHNLLLLSRVKDAAQRFWYLQQTAEHGWSRAVLDHHIETDLYARQLPAAKSHNFAQTLPPPQSDLAAQMLKIPMFSTFSTWATTRANAIWNGP